MAEITVADLKAATDVLQQLVADAEGLGVTKAIPLLEALAELEAQAKAVRSELTTRAIRGLEQPLIIGNKVWRKSPKIKLRPDQARIGSLVRQLVVKPDDNGELPPVDAAVEATINIMSAMYVSPSTEPKVTGLKLIGKTVGDVCNEESNGYELKFQEIPQ